MAVCRPATEADLPMALALGRAGHAASGLDVPFEDEAAANLFRGLIAMDGCFVTDRGMIGGCPMPLPYGTRPAFAVVLFWWGADGLVLLRRFRERWAPLGVRFGVFAHGRAPAIERATGCTVRETIMGDI